MVLVDITVVAEAADGVEAVELARRLRPDVCLEDIRMPRLDGIEVTRALAGQGVPDPLRVVVVTTFDVDEYVYGALRGGAVGFRPERRRPCAARRGRQSRERRVGIAAWAWENGIVKNTCRQWPPTGG